MTLFLASHATALLASWPGITAVSAATSPILPRCSHQRLSGR